MELWWHLRGWTRLRLTSADCAGRLRAISREIKLAELQFPDELTAEFTVRAGLEKKLLERFGTELEIIGGGGAPSIGRRVWRWRRLAVLTVLLGALTAWLPSRVWFLRVEGNSIVPARKILEAAEGCGICFGASAADIRSERVKNQLLLMIPELRWAGVNTAGCTAVITVAERQGGETAGEWCPGDVIAACDAVVTDVTVQRGTSLVKPGDGVQAGQMLISGLSDLGICTRAEQAEGEVWGLTRREISVALPSKTVERGDCRGVQRKFSLRIGKKSVNFSNDSGILYGTCVKMRTVDYLMLPGGFRLPVALVTDTYELCDTAPQQRGETDWLAMTARRMATEAIRAGHVLRERFAEHGGVLTAVFECREQIGVFRPGEFMERDTLD